MHTHITALCDSLESLVAARASTIGRILLGLLFLITGVNALLGFEGFVSFTAMFLPAATLMALAAIVLKIGGGLSLVLGIRPRLGAYALILFTLATVVCVHAPSWYQASGIDSARTQTEMVSILKNFAIVGGLLYVLVASPRSREDNASYDAE